MNIVITFDDNYVEYVLEMLYSLRLYNNNLIIHIIYDNLSYESIKKITEFINSNSIGKVKFYYYKISNKVLSVIKTEYITKSCYLRLYAPYILKDIDRFLYLDPDIVCQKSLDEIYNMDLGDKIIGACHNMLRENLDFLRKIMLKDLGLPVDSFYINSGVLLVDVKKYREFISIEQLDKFLEENTKHFEYHDQDAINYLFHEKIKLAAHEYNYQINAADSHNLNYNQVLIHYSEKNKPWQPKYLDSERAIPYYKLLYRMRNYEEEIQKNIYRQIGNNNK